ncbi:hypothetical protein G6O69_30560 [Pseudenhygromyxa sp. WMMC2535]|uniref:hypothetical protein n=1 Tax=Pseudenhygromyxa sp. WMMC2535 TaxID=2712867 RepID=UPI001555DCCC|nr:hypothetical protein [Pseudenhygromyxa sp. WMMC2535]NVB42205.1 hypothetical protein [Pseudenhygromyxa sp. WMMC2535]
MSTISAIFSSLVVMGLASAPPSLPEEPSAETSMEVTPPASESGADQPEIESPEQVRDDAAAGQGALPPPEQVRDEAAAGQGALPSPEQVREHQVAASPTAPPAEGVYAIGSSGVAPLPPPPPPVSPSAIPRGDWRGRGWLAVRLTAVGPISGEAPARPTVIALGGGAEGGWRPLQWLGLGASFSRQPHEIYVSSAAIGSARTKGHMTAWDVGFVRLWAPVRGRVEPFVDVGGGFAFYDPARFGVTTMGGTVRASLGLDVWITRSVTLGASGIYRANFIEGGMANVWQAALELAVHW